MGFDFSGKSVLVTGAARGLGFAVARAFHEAGARVAVNDRTPDSVAASIATLGGGSRFVAAPADLATASGCEKAVRQATDAFGALDVLVNNAAVNIEKPAEATDDAHWDLHLAVVMKAPFFCTRTALPFLRRNKGCVVNVASELGMHAIPNNVAYVSAKHGVLAMTRALAIELAPDGVRVNAICPGTMDTELMKECATDSGDPAAYYKAFNEYHPVGRIASPDEIAAFIVCMASPAASFLTGASIPIDGGSTAGRVPQ